MNEHQLWPLRWKGPLDDSPLRLVKGTPFNCVVIDPSPEAAAFAARARSEGVEVRTLGADIPAAPYAQIPVNSSAPALAITKCEWPRVRATDSQDSADAGPTGVPWVDSNGWMIQMLRARAPEKAIWLCLEPPEFFRPSACALAAADSAGYGAKWIAEPPPGDRQAWDLTVAATRFFERHRAWRSYRPLARLGIVSDFSGDNEFTSSEMLNLTARRHQPFRAIDQTKPIELTGLVAVIYADRQAPIGDALAKLGSFVQNGGLLLIQPSAVKPFQGTASKEAHPRFRFLASGKGRIAVGKGNWEDPYTTAADVHLLMSHRNDLIRLYNHASCGSYITSAPDGSDLVQLFRYSSLPSENPMTITVAGKYSSATFHSLDSERSQSIKPIPARTGTDIPLPAFSVYAAIELGK